MVFIIPEMSFPNAFIGNPLFMMPGFPVELGMTNKSYFAEDLLNKK